MKFYEALDIRPGITAVIGSGGKSTLLDVLARELAPATVLLCTTTHMFPPADLPILLTGGERELAEELARHRAVCRGVLGEDGRLHPAPIPIERMANLADYVLVEADGSRQLPLKAHAPHEPVIPEQTGQVVCVVGLSGLNRAIGQAAHRPERFAELAGAGPEDLATPGLAAAVLNAEGLADCYFLNQTDIPGGEVLARELASRLRRAAVCGSLHRGTVLC